MKPNVQIDGAFSGFAGETVVRLTNGQAWQQSQYLYFYHYDFMPAAALFDRGGQAYLRVSGVPHDVPVVAVSILQEGAIVSEFSGFRQGATFQFENGAVWQQVGGGFSYHYAYRPSAFVFEGLSGTQISVEDMDDNVTVRRLR